MLKLVSHGVANAREMLANVADLQFSSWFKKFFNNWNNFLRCQEKLSDSKLAMFASADLAFVVQ